MKLSDYFKAYDEFTSKTSEVARQLAFAGLALLWIFKNSSPSPDSPSMPNELIGPALIFVLALAADLLHYITGSVIWGAFSRLQERNIPANRDPEIDASVWLGRIIDFFFVLKVFLVAAGYYLLIGWLIKLWHVFA